MSAERWDVPSEKLRRIAEAPEPEIRPLTMAEKDRIVNTVVVVARGVEPLTIEEIS